MELVRSSISIASGLPRETVRSAPAITFSGPAQRSLTLRPARSRSRQATLYIESSDSFVASAAASIATGWSEPVPGRELRPLKSSAFHGALFRQLTQSIKSRFETPGCCLIRGEKRKCNLRNQHYPGWLLRPHQSIADEETIEYYTQLMREVDLLVYGRKTYQLMVPFWPDVAKISR